MRTMLRVHPPLREEEIVRAQPTRRRRLSKTEIEMVGDALHVPPGDERLIPGTDTRITRSPCGEWVGVRGLDEDVRKMLVALRSHVIERI